MRKSKEILEKLHREGEGLAIPQGLVPEKMKAFLEERGEPVPRKKTKWQPMLAAAACLGLAVGWAAFWLPGQNAPTQEPSKAAAADDRAAETALADTKEDAADGYEDREALKLPVMAYEEIYARLSESWQLAKAAGIEDLAMNRGEAMEKLEFDMTEDKFQANAEGSAAKQQAYGKTNVQTERVDEADRVKNDGRHLYQAIRRPAEEGAKEAWGIQILDTEGGLKEAAFVGGFESVEEFYVWEDLLLAIENKHSVYSGMAWEETVSSDKFSSGRGWHEISIYDIANRAAPRKVRTFTLQGQYESSRIYDGYFYGISRFDADAGQGVEDYGAYIPTLEGETLPAERIYCPSGSGGTGYLVFVSVDLKNPSVFADSRAVLTDGGLYYMSRNNLYAAGYRSVYGDPLEKEGNVTDRTEILRFSFAKGKLKAQARGEVPGRLNDRFSLDEYEGNLRAASTVQEYQARKVTDDRTGETIGMDYQELSQTNALYILDAEMAVKGKVTGLAEGEQIYAARFLGDAGYFVTFRQTDPLFALDLSDPSRPAVLGELKVSGFSEYLHFYKDNLLFGLGMEAEEESGREQGMKLSMFDLSERSAPREASRLHLKDYNYSEARWDSRALLIDPEENLIGFAAEGSDRGDSWKHYLLFAYEDGSFVQKWKVDARAGEDDDCRVRGTFIGDVFYLLKENGNVRSYRMDSGELLEEIP